ncbi:MAG: DUF1549 domain-containing protein [Candidatus Wallbacteria bacterium]|nr:DUF1549 domain-containing protein [Candidatus Wallbacteria bacterium]
MKTRILALAAALAANAWAVTPQDIERYFQARWSSQGVTPSATVADAVFLRRAWLDLVGVVPSPEDVPAFEAERDPAKRSRLIDRLLSDPRFGQAWGNRFKNLLLENSDVAKNRRLIHPFELWLAQSLNSNLPYDRLVRKLIAGQGSVHENPEGSYVAQFRESPEALTGHMAKRFLGVQIQCAQCHDHPFEKWKRKDFYGLHAFFARVKDVPVPLDGLAALRAGKFDEALFAAQKEGRDPRKQQRRARVLEQLASQLPEPSLKPDALAAEMALMNKGKPPEKARTFVVVDRPRGEAVIPDLKAPPGDKSKRPAGEEVHPRFLDGTAPTWPDPFVNRREELAAWMTDKKNPYFARALVNRVWSVLLGRGLIEPVDNVAAPAEKTHALLLDRLAAHFVESGCDFKGLLRLIASTSVYQRSIAPSTKNAKDRAEFAHGSTRPMEPEQLFTSLLAATGAEEALRAKGGENIEVMRSRMMDRFAKVFENDSGEEDEQFHGSLTQALFLLNAPALHRSLAAGPTGTVRQAIEAAFHAGAAAAGIAHLYLAAFARSPTPEESLAATQYLDASGATQAGRPLRGKPQGWSDLLWSMVTSAEFLVNH